MTPPKPLTYGVFVGVKMPATLAQQVKAHAQRNGSSVSDVIRQAVTVQLQNSPEVPG